MVSSGLHRLGPSIPSLHEKAGLSHTSVDNWGFLDAGLVHQREDSPKRGGSVPNPACRGVARPRVAGTAGPGLPRVGASTTGAEGHWIG